MTGPEHYAEAERLLEQADQMMSDDLRKMPKLTTAQVHATLALAAAQVDGTLGSPDDVLADPRAEAWRGVLAS